MTAFTIAVLNFSGNVGKSLIARHLLAPRIPGAQVLAVESINADEGGADETVKGRQFADVLEALQIGQTAVVDIGASNIEDTMAVLRRYAGSHEDFDLFVVPVVPDRKQQRDTAATIVALADMGVPADKIRVVFNKLKLGDRVQDVFAPIFYFAAAKRMFTLRPGAVLHENEIYARLNGTSADLREIAADSTDWKAKISETDDTEERLQFAQCISRRRLAVGVVAEHDAVFAALME